MDGSERATRYFEAVHAAWFKRMEAKVVSTPEEHSEALALAAMAVADAERDEARAEVERLRRSVQLRGEVAREADRRTATAEAEVRDLRAKVAAVEALADKEDARVAEVNGRLAARDDGDPNGKPFRIVGILPTLEVRAALASAGRTEPAGEAGGEAYYTCGHAYREPGCGWPCCGFPDTPAPFARYSGTAGSNVDAALGGDEHR